MNKDNQSPQNIIDDFQPNYLQDYCDRKDEHMGDGFFLAVLAVSVWLLIKSFIQELK